MNLFDMIAKSYSEVRSKLELPIQGTAAHDAAAVGNPVQIGGVYRATDPAVADGDAVSLRVNAKGEAIVSVAGSKLEEQLDQSDAVDNVLTFSANIIAIEIYHDEATWQDFTVNGLTIKVPAGGYRSLIGGASAASVTIPAGINCIVGRLI